MIVASEHSRQAVTSMDRIVVGFAALACMAGIAGIGLFGNALLYFYVAYALGTLGTLVMLLVALSSEDLRTGDMAWTIRVGIVCFVALAVRAFLFYHGPLLSFDLHWYADYVKFLQMHFQPYSAQFFFPYPQGFLDFLLPFAYAANPLPAIHWALITVDCLVAVAIVAVVGRISGRTTGFWCGLAYALMPMPALEVGRIGHFETLVSACLVGLLLALHKRRSFAAAFAITAATCLKAFPIVIAPVIFRTWKSKRRVIYSAAGAFFALLLSVAPFIANLQSVLDFWLGASSSSPLSAGTFVANSLPALAADVPRATPLVAAAQAAALLLFVLLCAYSIRSARRFENDGRAGMGRLDLRGVSASGYRLTVVVPSTARFAIGLFLAALFIYGCYLIGKPWAPSQYAYSWWYPTPLLIGMGTALASLTAVGIYCVMRDETPLVPAQTLSALMAAVLGFSILLHANVNPWYLMPMIVLLLGMAPARFAIVALGCILTFYASYNSTSFSSLGWNDVITTPKTWNVHLREEPSAESGGTVTRRIGAGPTADYALTVDPNVKAAFLVLAYNTCAPSDVSFVLQDQHQATSFTRPVILGGATVPLPAGARAFTLSVQKASCAPTVRVVRAANAPASVVAHGSDVAIRMPTSRLPGGWSHSVSATSSLFAWAFPNTAVAFDVIGDSDPTFHYWPFAFSAFVRGSTVDGQKTGWIAIHGDDTSATSIGPIRYRIPVFNLPARLNTIEGIRIVARGGEDHGGDHTLRINNIRVVNEARWGVWTRQSTAFVVVCVLAAAAIVYYFAMLSFRRDIQ